MGSAPNLALSRLVQLGTCPAPPRAMSAADLDTLPLRPSVRAALREARRALHAMYGDRLVKLVLFGSHARGEAHDESDVDLLVVLRGDFCSYDEIKRTGGVIQDASLNYQQALSLIFLDEGRFVDRGHPLMMNVLEESVEL